MASRRRTTERAGAENRSVRRWKKSTTKSANNFSTFGFNANSTFLQLFMLDTPSPTPPTPNPPPQNPNSTNQKKNPNQHGLLNVAQALAASAQRTPEAGTRKWSKKSALGATPIPFDSIAPVLSLPVELLAHLLAFFDPASLAVAQRGTLPNPAKFQRVNRRLRSLPALEISHRGRAQLASCL